MGAIWSGNIPFYQSRLILIKVKTFDKKLVQNKYGMSWTGLLGGHEEVELMIGPKQVLVDYEGDAGFR